MSIKQINFLFKFIVLVLGFSGLLLLLFIAPKIGEIVTIKSLLNIVLTLFWLTSLPVLYILVTIWQMSSNLLSDHFFSKKNSRRLIYIAYAGIIESILYAIATVLGFFLFKGNYPYFLICLFFFFLGIIIAVLASLLSYIFKLANQLKDENDLTI